MQDNTILYNTIQYNTLQYNADANTNTNTKGEVDANSKCKHNTMQDITVEIQTHGNYNTI